MKKGGFGDYLVDKGVITQAQHEEALRQQNKDRLLGQIAIEENYLDQEQVNAITDHIRVNPRMLFGEAAISLGFLSNSKLRYLLDIRTRRKIRIGDILVKMGFISEEELHKQVMTFESKRHRLHKVLLCDNTMVVMRMLERMLKNYNYEVLLSRNGAEALQVANEVRPDIFICSTILEDMDGYQLCYKMLTSTATANIRPILLSSDIDAKAVERAFESGVTHFMKKPVKEHELINVIYQLERELSEKRPERILVADDSPGARIIIRKELSSIWSDIQMAENGLEALKKAKSLKPDIIVLDVEMPVMTGLEACKRLKEDPETENIPVVFVTGLNSPEFRAKGFEVGAVEYFGKPFQAGHLADFLKVLCESKNIQKEETILVVEDSATTRHILTYFLQKNGFAVKAAANGKEALILLESITPNLIVTDCYMPGLDGFDLTKAIRANEKLRRTPIIMITASSARADVLKGLDAGANDYLVKPFDEAEMVARINAHLRNSELLLQLEAEKEKLRVANEEKDRYISIAAHDLRNPLGSIRGFAELLLEEQDGSENAKQFLGIIKGASEGMLLLLEDLLDISKIESGKVMLNTMECDLSELVESRVQLSKVMADRKGISLDYNKPSGKISTTCDMQKVAQVLDNLLSNAIKFSPTKTSIHVMVDDYVSNVRVGVKDEGPGIPEAEKEKLFKPFSRLSIKPTGGEKSTGLGLSISAKIVQAHGGEIGVDSKTGVGSVFWFTLPKGIPLSD